MNVKANPTKWGIKWALLAGLIAIVILPACKKCDDGKAKLLVAVYQGTVDASNLVDSAYVRMACGKTEYPGGLDDNYHKFLTTDYTGKVMFEDLSRNDFFFYGTATVPTEILEFNADTNWLVMKDASLSLYTNVYNWVFYDSTISELDENKLKLYVDHIYEYENISGIALKEITNKRGEQTVALILCSTLSGTACDADPDNDKIP